VLWHETGLKKSALYLTPKASCRSQSTWTSNCSRLNIYSLFSHHRT
jgi:hypothetical protein